MAKAPKQAGLVSEDLIANMCEHVKQHNSIQTAYRIEGLTDPQYAMVMEEAEREPKSLAAKLKAKLEQAEAMAEAEGMAAVNTLAMQGHAGAVMWRMERRYSGHWAKSEGKNVKEGAAGAAAPQIMIPPNGRESGSAGES